MDTGLAPVAISLFLVDCGIRFLLPVDKQQNTGNGDLKAKQDTFNLIPLARTDEADESAVRNDKMS